MRAGLLTIAVVACLATGCTSAHHAVTSPSPTPSSTTAVATPTKTPTPTPSQLTVPADVPTTGPNLNHPGEKPPVMPLLATQHTPAGAVAFAKFFELTTDWGFATTSSAYMKHYMQPTCLDCLSIRDGLDRAAMAHEHYVGDRLTITHAATRSGPPPRGADSGVDVTYDVTSAEVLTSHNAYVDAEPAAKAQDLLWLSWRKDGWTVVQLVPVH